jgi:hypothetical protein
MVTKKKQTTKSKVAKAPVSNVGNDFKNAALVVSVTINVAVFVGWLAIQVTTKYDQQVAQLLFT